MQSKNPGNFMAPFGINHRELVEAAGGLKAEPQKLISGGPMMGFAMVTMDAPVTKTSSSILLFKEDVVAKSLETACINCGRCDGDLSKQNYSIQTCRLFKEKR